VDAQKNINGIDNECTNWGDRTRKAVRSPPNSGGKAKSSPGPRDDWDNLGSVKKKKEKPR